MTMFKIGSKVKEPIDRHFLETVANKVVDILDRREADKKSARVAAVQAELDRHKKKCTHLYGLHTVPLPYDDVMIQCGHCMKVWK